MTTKQTYANAWPAIHAETDSSGAVSLSANNLNFIMSNSADGFSMVKRNILYSANLQIS